MSQKGKLTSSGSVRSCLYELLDTQGILINKLSVRVDELEKTADQYYERACEDRYKLEKLIDIKDFFKGVMLVILVFGAVILTGVWLAALLTGRI